MSTAQISIVTRIIDELKAADRICVVGHMRPDGDCVGSQVGLALALKALGKKVVCWNQDDVPPKLRFMVPQSIMQKPEPGQQFDVVVAIDCASYERLGTVGECVADRKMLINIDHHSSNTRYGNIDWVSARKPSTGELIFELLKTAGWPISSHIADCLYTAISTDTGSFMYPTTRPDTYQTAAELVELGANLGKICQQVYQSFPLSRVRLLRELFNRFKLTHNNEIAYFWLKKEDFKRTGADQAETEGLIDHLRDIEPVVVACVLEETEPGVIRMSLRSKSRRVNVSKIAGLFGGGGHQAAAGARIEGKPISVQRKVLRAIRNALDAVARPKPDEADGSK